MKTYDSIIQGFYTPLRGYLGREVVPSNEEAPRPELPFCSYNVINPRLVQYGPMSGHVDTVADGEIVTERKETDVEVVFSFNFFGQTDLEAMSLASKAEEYLDFVGEYELNSRGLTVVDITNVQDRTLYLGDAYEHRVGFDVRFRVKETKERVVIHTIDDAEIEQI